MTASHAWEALRKRPEALPRFPPLRWEAGSVRGAGVGECCDELTERRGPSDGVPTSSRAPA
jgi:hypothetical protein